LLGGDRLTFVAKNIAAGAVSAVFGEYTTVGSTGAAAGNDITISGAAATTGNYGIVYNASGVTLDVVVSGITVEGSPSLVLPADKSAMFTVNASGRLEIVGTGVAGTGSSLAGTAQAWTVTNPGASRVFDAGDATVQQIAQSHARLLSDLKARGVLG